MKNMKIKSIFAQILKNHYVDTVFSLPAYYIADLSYALKCEDINIIEFASEFSAISAAYSYTVISNKVGITLVNTGPSFTNILTGLKTAEKDNVPLIVIVGCQEPQIYDNECYFQTVKISQFCKYCYTITSESIHKLDSYIRLAVAKRTPIVLQIPYTIYNLEIDYQNNMDNVNLVELENFGIISEENIQSDADEFCKKLLQESKPLFLLGKGVACTKIPNLLEKNEIPFVSSLLAKRHLYKYESYRGAVGILGDPIANSYLRESDSIICVGCRLSERTIINDVSIVCDKNIYFINDGDYICKYNIDPRRLFEYHYDAEKYLKICFDFLQNKIGNTFKWKCNEQRINKNRECKSSAFTTTEAVHIISDIPFKTPIYCIDDGTYTLPALKLNANHQIVFPGSMAVGGFSVGAAVGAYYANSDSTPIIIIGDGGILSVLGELHTIEKNNVKVLIIVINNNGYESIRQWYGDKYNEVFASINFLYLAKAFNIPYVQVKSSTELKKELLNEINSPRLLEVIVETEKTPCHFKNYDLE